MNYFFLEPEVAGALGENTVLDASTHPPRVEKLHFEFSGWLGDAILESFPCVIATLRGYWQAREPWFSQDMLEHAIHSQLCGDTEPKQPTHQFK
ncbi:hypothetical protein HI806_01945 [Ralstonia solanacearum]|uniref:hypothetical protein n=1 Tax=Ralstonia pseudosolanacearum TaxID=1310165 RepID=UPI000578AB44|nr:hypothetical protein [Ralstonia pseudosolanacearum]APF85630.1 hypothetical protein BCR16_01845 [Ralstonia solanacearum FJAT-1458]QKL69769.1 hypothetical protein HI806_01945 [Ralstonia solanacearum]MDO3620789.1 hypothetical protein [Ralstonia pseudosolanacearum]QKL74981.1 hypothetical protein HI805_01950 [Ralstonia solanacearum]QKL80183.1 hypothetical protein HI804_01955 [Ralstonia solanacearum]